MFYKIISCNTSIMTTYATTNDTNIAYDVDYRIENSSSVYYIFTVLPCLYLFK